MEDGDDVEVTYSIHPPRFVVLSDDDDRPPSPLESEPDTTRHVLDDELWDTARRPVELSSIDGASAGEIVRPKGVRPLQSRSPRLPPSIKRRGELPFDEGTNRKKETDKNGGGRSKPKLSVITGSSPPLPRERKSSRPSVPRGTESPGSQSHESDGLNRNAHLPRKKEAVMLSDTKQTIRNRLSVAEERKGSIRLSNLKEKNASSKKSHHRKASRDSMPDDERQYLSAPVLSVSLFNNTRSGTSTPEERSVTKPPRSPRKKQLSDGSARLAAAAKAEEDENAARKNTTSPEPNEKMDEKIDSPAVSVYEVDSEISEIKKGIEELEALLEAARKAEAEASNDEPVTSAKASGKSTEKEAPSNQKPSPRTVLDTPMSSHPHDEFTPGRSPQKASILTGEKVASSSSEGGKNAPEKAESTEEQEIRRSSSPAQFLYPDSLKEKLESMNPGTEGDQKDKSAFSLFPTEAVSREESPTNSDGKPVQGEEDGNEDDNVDPAYVSQVASSTLVAAAGASNLSEAAALTFQAAGEAVENLLLGEAEKQPPKPPLPAPTNYSSDTSLVSTDTDKTEVMGNLTSSKKERAVSGLGDISEASEAEEKGVDEAARSLGQSDSSITRKSSRESPISNSDDTEEASDSGSQGDSSSTPPPPPPPLEETAASDSISSSAADEASSRSRSKAPSPPTLSNNEENAEVLERVESRDDSSDSTPPPPPKPKDSDRGDTQQQVSPRQVPIGEAMVKALNEKSQKSLSPCSPLPEATDSSADGSSNQTKLQRRPLSNSAPSRTSPPVNPAGEQPEQDKSTRKVISKSADHYSPTEGASAKFDGGRRQQLSPRPYEEDGVKSRSVIGVSKLLQPRLSDERKDTIESTPKNKKALGGMAHDRNYVKPQFRRVPEAEEASTNDSATLSKAAADRNASSDERRINRNRLNDSPREANASGTTIVDVIMDPTLLDSASSDESPSEHGLLVEGSSVSTHPSKSESQSEVDKQQIFRKEEDKVPRTPSKQGRQYLSTLSGSGELDAGLDHEAQFVDFGPDGEPLIPSRYLSPDGKHETGGESISEEEAEATAVTSLDATHGVAKGDIMLSLLDETAAQTGSEVKGRDKVHSAIWRMRDLRNKRKRSKHSSAHNSPPRKINIPVDIDKGRGVGGWKHIKALQEAVMMHLEVDEFDECIEIYEDIMFAFTESLTKTKGISSRNSSDSPIQGGDDEDYVSQIGVSLHNIGILHSLKDEFEEASSFFRKASVMLKSSVGEDHPDHVSALVRLAMCKFAQEEFPESHKLLDEALALAKGKNTSLSCVVQIGEILNNLGCLTFMSGSRPKAVKYFKESLEVQFVALSQSLYGLSKQARDAISLNISISRANVGYIKLISKDLKAAVTGFEAALMHQQLILGDAHDTVTATMDNLAISNLLQGKKGKALSMLNRVLYSQVQAYGPDDRRCAVSLNKIHMVKTRDKDLADRISKANETPGRKGRANQQESPHKSPRPRRAQKKGFSLRNSLRLKKHSK